jgi:hypothetical protein
LFVRFFSYPYFSIIFTGRCHRLVNNNNVRLVNFSSPVAPFFCPTREPEFVKNSIPMRNQSSYRINPNFLSPPPRYDLSIYSVSPLHKITTEINRINFPEFGRHGSSVELFVEIPIVSSTTPYSQTFARRRWICPEPAAPQIEQRRRQEPRQVSRRERAFHSSAREGTTNSYGESQVEVEGS